MDLDVYQGFEGCLGDKAPGKTFEFRQGGARWCVVDVHTAFFGFATEFNYSGEVTCAVYVVLAVDDCLFEGGGRSVSTVVITVA